MSDPYSVHLADVFMARRRLAGLAIRTPVRRSNWLSERTGAQVFLKMENLQVTSSFKYRGALNALTCAKEGGHDKIFTASAGNHGLGLAEASIHTGSDVTVCIPTNASSLKRGRLKRSPVKLIEHGDDCEITEQFARRLAAEKKGLYISPYNNKEVIAGQGTAALELFEDVPDIDTLVVAVGGGGLISGCGVVVNTIKPSARLIGVVAENSPVMTTCVNAGRIVRARQEPTIADGIAGNIEPDSITFPMIQENVDDWVVVEEKDIITAVFEFLDYEGMLIEGAAAAAIAAASHKLFPFKPKEKVGIIVCGANIARQQWREILGAHIVGESKLKG